MYIYNAISALKTFLRHLTVKINETETALHTHNVTVVKCPLLASISLALPQTVFNSWLNKSWCSPQFKSISVQYFMTEQTGEHQVNLLPCGLCSVGSLGLGRAACPGELPFCITRPAARPGSFRSHALSEVWEPQTFSLLFINTGQTLEAQLYGPDGRWAPWSQADFCSVSWQPGLPAPRATLAWLFLGYGGKESKGLTSLSLCFA